MQNNNLKIGLTIIVILISAVLAVLCLLMSFGILINSSGLSSDIAFGLSIVFIMWCKYEYTENLKQTNDNEEAEKSNLFSVIIFNIVPRILIICIAALWLLDVDNYGFLLGSAACLLLGVEALLDYKANKNKGEILFALIYCSVVVVSIIFIIVHL